jgi:hypothetical protein
MKTFEKVTKNENLFLEFIHFTCALMIIVFKFKIHKYPIYQNHVNNNFWRNKA